MIESKKTVFSSSTVGEFNSSFLIAESLVNPLIKSVFATLTIKPTESLSTRMEVFHNCIKDVYENGAGHYQTYIHQVIQAYFHYSVSGLYTSLLFPG